MKPVDVDRLIAWLEEHANDRTGEPVRLMPWQQRLLEDVWALDGRTPVFSFEARRTCEFRPWS